MKKILLLYNLDCSITLTFQTMKNVFYFFIFYYSIGFANCQVWIHYDTTNSGISDNSITRIAIDASGNKWFGTLNHGIVKFDGTIWTNYLILPPYYIKAIEAEGDTIWVGGVSGLARYIGGNWTFYNNSNSGLLCNDITAIAIDGFGNKWIGTTCGYSGGGLTKFDNNTWTNYYPGNSGIPFSIALSIGVDSNNNIWAGSSGLDTNASKKGLVKFDGTSWTIYDSSNSGFPDYGARSITFDTAGILWAGTGYHGIVKFDGSNWTVYDTSNTPTLQGSQYNSFSVFVDRHNKKWITGLCKLATYDDNNWINYDSINTPLPWCSYAGMVAFDNNQNVWISANGVWVIDFTSNISESITSDEYNLDIFPNPFSNVASIYNKLNKELVLTIYNSLGNKVMEKLLSSDLTEINRGNLASGIYFYKTVANQKIIYKGKLIIE